MLGISGNDDAWVERSGLHRRIQREHHDDLRSGPRMLVIDHRYAYTGHGGLVSGDSNETGGTRRRSRWLPDDKDSIFVAENVLPDVES